MNEVERVVQFVLDDPANIGRMSCGETIVAALIFNRMDWLPLHYKHPLDAVDRLGENWLQMAIKYRRENS